MRNKGITLITLVVTIIILLILAGVTIGMATSGTGLFDKAKEATQKYQNIQSEEETEIAKAINEIDTITNGRASTDIRVVETWHNGTEWYRVWSDGWIEQGGNATSGTTDTGNQIMLNKNFNDTNYTINMTIAPNNAGSREWY